MDAASKINIETALETSPVTCAVTGVFCIDKITLALLISANSQGLVTGSKFINRKKIPFHFKSFTDYFGFTLPDTFNWEITIEEVEFKFYSSLKKLELDILIKDYCKITGSAQFGGNKPAYSLELALIDSFLFFKDIPVIGNVVGQNDGIGIEKASFVNEPSNKSLGISFEGTLVIAGNSMDVKPHLETAQSDMAGNSAYKSKEYETPQITWIEINKSFKVLFIMRLGFALEGGKVKVCVDARFNLSILSIEFYELFLSIPISSGEEFDYGISGLFASLNKPPIYIGGGLYKAPGEILYNGKLVIKISKFSLTALGSYGELGGGKASFFAFLMLEYPLGGPAFFFVTGIALGFGINRSIVLPELSQIKKFPFVAAAIGQGGLTPDSKPVEALNKLSEWVRLCDGENFACAGVRFKSFGLLDSFALLSIEFGNKLRITLLGLSRLSLPPNLKRGDPIAFAELSLRAVIDPDEGTVEITAALSKESYLLDKRCHLTGGAAFCSWSKGQYAGDFVITIGGCHHPKFQNIHYPEIEKVGIDWKITSELSLKGNSYFALTPSCIMAGAYLDLSYTSGKLKAWLRVEASFIIKWKPFFYEASFHAFIGVSYDLWTIFGTIKFKFELGASVEIRGPEFSGSVHISLYIVSFTIRFGSSGSKPQPIDWDEFYGSFLDNAGDKAIAVRDRALDGKDAIDILVGDGVVREIEAKKLYIVNGQNLAIYTRSTVPSTKITFNGNTIGETGKGVKLGIVPMGVNELISLQEVTVSGKDLDTSILKCSCEYENVPSALWDTQDKGVNSGLINNVPIGLKISLKENQPNGIIPSRGAYDMETLLEHECVVEKSIAWKEPESVRGKDYSRDNPIKRILETINSPNRDDILKPAAGYFKTDATANIKRFAKAPGDYLYDNPTLSTTGAIREVKEFAGIFENGKPYPASAFRRRIQGRG